MIRVALVASLLGATLVSSATADSPPTDDRFIRVCDERSGTEETIGDLNIRREVCAEGQKPLRLATWPQGRGRRGPEGPRGPRGPAGVSDTEVVSTTTATNGSPGKSAVVRCPRGTEMTGGGYSTSVLSTDLVLRQSSPFGNSAWTADVYEDGLASNISWSLTVSVVCAS